MGILSLWAAYEGNAVVAIASNAIACIMFFIFAVFEHAEVRLDRRLQRFIIEFGYEDFVQLRERRLSDLHWLILPQTHHDIQWHLAVFVEQVCRTAVG